MARPNSQPIGIFDSGIGGLTLTKEIVKFLPNESIVYLGDTARVPYGTRGKEIITKFALELTRFLLTYNVKILIVACNTISATSLEEIQKLSPVPVIGVIKPAALSAVKTTNNKKIGVIGTRATILSQIYERELASLDPQVQVFTQSCPLFVPIAEEGLGNQEVGKLMAKQYLKVFNSSNIDTLILGCTHYPMLSKSIQEAVGKSVKLVDSAKPTAFQVKQLLQEKNLLTTSKNQPSRRFFVTDAPERVKIIANLFFGNHIASSIIKVVL